MNHKSNKTKVNLIKIKVSLNFTNEEVTELPPSVRADLDKLIQIGINHLNKNSEIRKAEKGFHICDVHSCKEIPIEIEFYDTDKKIMTLCKKAIRRLTNDKTLLKCFRNDIYSFEKIEMIR